MGTMGTRCSIWNLYGVFAPMTYRNKFPFNFKITMISIEKGNQFNDNYFCILDIIGIKFEYSLHFVLPGYFLPGDFFQIVSYTISMLLRNTISVRRRNLSILYQINENRKRMNILFVHDRSNLIKEFISESYI